MDLTRNNPSPNPTMAIAAASAARWLTSEAKMPPATESAAHPHKVARRSKSTVYFDRNAPNCIEQDNAEKITDTSVLST